MVDDEESVVGTSPPPRKSDVLFGSGTDWQANACVNGIDDLAAYQNGYRRAALHLAEYVCDAERGQDFLVLSNRLSVSSPHRANAEIHY